MDKCTNETYVRYQEKKYGENIDTKKELITQGILPKYYDTNQFITFDIETINLDREESIGRSTVIHAEQSPISIALSTGSGDYFFVRKDMSTEAVGVMVKEFLTKLTELRIKYYKQIPPSIKNYYEEMKDELLAKSTSVKRKQEIYRHSQYIRNMLRLKVLGFNSQSFDLPVLFPFFLQNTSPSKMKVIKRGLKYFCCDFDGLSFRDARNYLGPGSLSKMSKVYAVAETKTLFPYELFRNMGQINTQLEWPDYPDFKSSLGGKRCYVNDLSHLVSQFENFGAMLEFFKCDCSLFSNAHLSNPTILDYNEEQLKLLSEHFTVPPEEYKNSKFEYDKNIATKRYQSFACYLKGRDIIQSIESYRFSLIDIIFENFFKTLLNSEIPIIDIFFCVSIRRCIFVTRCSTYILSHLEYNLNDTRMLLAIMQKFTEKFVQNFGVDVMSKLSLPGIAESSMWRMFDSRYGHVFSFPPQYKHINEEIRRNITGGPSVVFHRHAETKLNGQFPPEVSCAPSGERITNISSFDYNALFLDYKYLYSALF